MRDKREELLGYLCKTLHRCNTSQVMISLLCAILKDYKETGEVHLMPDLHGTPLVEVVDMAAELQDDIDWDSLLQGYVSVGWQMAHELHLQTCTKISRFDTGETWGRCFVEACITYTEDMWKFRNGLLHRDTRVLSREKMKKALRGRIHELYRENNVLFLPEDLKVFSCLKVF